MDGGATSKAPTVDPSLPVSGDNPERSGYRHSLRHLPFVCEGYAAATGV